MYLLVRSEDLCLLVPYSKEQRDFSPTEAIHEVRKKIAVYLTRYYFHQESVEWSPA